MKFLILVLLISAGAFAAPVMPKKMSAIYSYTCTHNFIEGEGVGNGFISCLPGQHLGKYSAEYQYYLFKTLKRTNFPLKGTSRFFEAPICGATIERYSCESGAPKLEFGLSELPQGDFQVAVSLTTNPDRMVNVVGYAALPNVKGECPEGLVRIRPYIAFPPSLFQPLPSTFINLGGSLNSMVVTTEETSKDKFSIIRTPAQKPCDESGKCQAPGGAGVIAKEVPYIESSPVVCAVPANAVSQVEGF